MFCVVETGEFECSESVSLYIYIVLTDKVCVVCENVQCNNQSVWIEKRIIKILLYIHANLGICVVCSI